MHTPESSGPNLSPQEGGQMPNLEPSQTPQEPQKSPQKSKKLLAMMLGLAVFVLGIGTYLLSSTGLFQGFIGERADYQDLLGYVSVHDDTKEEDIRDVPEIPVDSEFTVKNNSETEVLFWYDPEVVELTNPEDFGIEVESRTCEEWEADAQEEIDRYESNEFLPALFDRVQDLLDEDISLQCDDLINKRLFEIMDDAPVEPEEDDRDAELACEEIAEAIEGAVARYEAGDMTENDLRDLNLLMEIIDNTECEDIDGSVIQDMIDSLGDDRDAELACEEIAEAVEGAFARYKAGEMTEADLPDLRLLMQIIENTECEDVDASLIQEIIEELEGDQEAPEEGEPADDAVDCEEISAAIEGAVARYEAGEMTEADLPDLRLLMQIINSIECEEVDGSVIQDMISELEGDQTPEEGTPVQAIGSPPDNPMTLACIELVAEANAILADPDSYDTAEMARVYQGLEDNNCNSGLEESLYEQIINGGLQNLNANVLGASVISSELPEIPENAIVLRPGQAASFRAMTAAENALSILVRDQGENLYVAFDIIEPEEEDEDDEEEGADICSDLEERTDALFRSYDGSEAHRAKFRAMQEELEDNDCDQTYINRIDELLVSQQPVITCNELEDRLNDIVERHQRGEITEDNRDEIIGLRNQVEVTGCPDLDLSVLADMLEELDQALIDEITCDEIKDRYEEMLARYEADELTEDDIEDLEFLFEAAREHNCADVEVSRIDDIINALRLRDGQEDDLQFTCNELLDEFRRIKAKYDAGELTEEDIPYLESFAEQVEENNCNFIDLELIDIILEDLNSEEEQAPERNEEFCGSAEIKARLTLEAYANDELTEQDITNAAELYAQMVANGCDADLLEELLEVISENSEEDENPICEELEQEMKTYIIAFNEGRLDSSILSTLNKIAEAYNEAGCDSDIYAEFKKVIAEITDSLEQSLQRAEQGDDDQQGQNQLGQDDQQQQQNQNENQNQNQNNNNNSGGGGGGGISGANRFVPECRDNFDNDGDGFTDLDDPGCSTKNDNNESNDPVSRSGGTPACSDGIDNDGDGKVDLEDPGCLNAAGTSEEDKAEIITETSKTLEEIIRDYNAHLDVEVLEILAASKIVEFDDVDPDEVWAYPINSISSVTIKDGDEGIIVGYPDGDFKPNRNINRAEAVKLILVGLGIPDYLISLDDPSLINVQPDFSDVPQDEWYTDEVNLAAAIALVNGYEDGSFRPADFILRSEFIRMLYTAHQLINLNDDFALEKFQCSFLDVSESDWYYEVAHQSCNLGIAYGYRAGDDFVLGGDREITRQEATALILNTLIINGVD